MSHHFSRKKEEEGKADAHRLLHRRSEVYGLAMTLPLTQHGEESGLHYVNITFTLF